MVAGPEDPTAITFPIATLDFEASGLGPASYPIEVGVCVWRGPDTPIAGWSCLIRPTDAWLSSGEWNPKAEAVHGLSQAALAAGITPTGAMDALNALLSETGVGWCDGGQYDLHWARTLAAASDLRAAWKLGHWDMLTQRLGDWSYERMARWLDRAPPRHRARDDAERLMKGLARGLKTTIGGSVDLKLAS